MMRPSPTAIGISERRTDAIYRPLNDFLYDFDRTESSKDGDEEDDDDDTETGCSNAVASAKTPPASRRTTSSKVVRCRSNVGCAANQRKLQNSSSSTKQHKEPPQLPSSITFYGRGWVSDAPDRALDYDRRSWNSIVAAVADATPTRTGDCGVSKPDMTRTWVVDSGGGRHVSSATDFVPHQRCLSSSVLNRGGLPQVNTAAGESRRTTTREPGGLHHHQQQRTRDGSVGRRYHTSKLTTATSEEAYGGCGGLTEAKQSTTSIV